jgi:hypothetical protein
MQSTGQVGRHNSQPVQCISTTACMNLKAPTIASVGQAGRQRAQPMQRDSSISATRNGASAPHSAWWAAVDGLAFLRNGLGIRPTGWVTASLALGLRQQPVNGID